MAQDRTTLRAPPAIQRRPAVSNGVQRSAPESARSPARALQQRLGSRGAQLVAAQVVARSRAPGHTVVAAKSAGPFSLSDPGDAHEREADRVADVVMRTTVRGSTSTSPSISTVRRACADCQEEISTRGRTDQPVVAGDTTHVHRSASAGGASQVSPPVATNIQNMKGGGAPLSASTRALFEPRFGADFSHVRVHTDSRAADTATAIHARAFTVGDNIAFNAGQYVPQSDEGKRLLAHELTHVVQHSADQPTPAVRRQLDDLSEEDIEDFDYSPDEKKLAEDTGEAAESSIGEVGGTKVGKAGRISREQYLRKTPVPTAGTSIVSTLHFNTWVYVEKRGGDKDGWYKVVSNAGEIGWIPAVAAALDPPEPEAELYQVQSGDSAINLVAQWYKPKGGFTRAWNPTADDPGDARFYVAALAFANKGRAGMKSPADLSEVSAWKKVEVIAPHTIWKPSRNFLNALKGKVTSGSITKAVWDAAASVVMAVVDFVVGAASFIGGLIYGALESIYDLFAGVVDLIKMIWDVLVSLFTGNIVSDAKALWDTLTKIDPGAIWEEFKSKWNAESVAERWFFRGRVIGYVIMEIVMMFFSAGVLTALKWAGKFAKLGELLAKLPKIAELAGKMGKAVKAIKLPEKAAELLKFKKVGKGAKILEGVEAGMESIELYLNSVEHVQKRSAAWLKYTSRGGKKARAGWEAIYDTLTRNRLKGRLAEEQFAIIMKGSPQDIWVKVAGKSTLRKVDNVLGNTAREIKSGPLKLTPFIEKQILKDIELINAKSMKVEWHLLAGGDSNAIAALKKAGINVILY